MHAHGGSLYGTTKTGHMLVLMFPNGLNPSVAMPSFMFLGSAAKSKCILSNTFHASPSAGWLSSLSTGCRFSLCHCTSRDDFFEMNIRCSLGIKGKCLSTFSGIDFFPSASFHLDALHFG